MRNFLREIAKVKSPRQDPLRIRPGECAGGYRRRKLHAAAETYHRLLSRKTRGSVRALDGKGIGSSSTAAHTEAKMKRGTIVWINLEDTAPPELGNTRPGILVSHTEQNHILPTVVIVPLSSRASRALAAPATPGDSEIEIQVTQSRRGFAKSVDSAFGYYWHGLLRVHEGPRRGPRRLS
jgi:hypothetical protein